MSPSEIPDHDLLDEQDPATIGGRIRRARKSLGLAQGDLARRLEVSQPTVANWEADAHNPRQLMLAKLAHALEVSLGWLAGGEALDRLSADHPAAHYLARKILHVPILPPEALSNRQALMAGDLACSAIHYVPVATNRQSLFGLYADPGRFVARFPHGTLFIFDHNDHQPEAERFALVASKNGPQLHQWSTALTEAAGGECLGSLFATMNHY